MSKKVFYMLCGKCQKIGSADCSSCRLNQEAFDNMQSTINRQTMTIHDLERWKVSAENMMESMDRLKKAKDKAEELAEEANQKIMRQNLNSQPNRIGTPSSRITLGDRERQIIQILQDNHADVPHRYDHGGKIKYYVVYDGSSGLWEVHTEYAEKFPMAWLFTNRSDAEISCNNLNTDFPEGWAI